MPIWEYECPKCGTMFERMLIKTSELNSPVMCPECGAEAKKLVSHVRKSGIKMTGGQRFLNNGKTDC